MSQHELSRQVRVLAQAFNFSPEDVAANRAGNLTAAQMERITHKHHKTTRMVWVLFGSIFGVGLLGFSASMIHSENFGVKTMLIFVGVTVFFGMIAWAFILFNRYLMKRTFQEGSVHSVKGKFWLIAERNERSIVRYVAVGKYRFRIDRYSDFDLLQKSGIVGQEVIMYISAPWRGLLSVEIRE